MAYLLWLFRELFFSILSKLNGCLLIQGFSDLPSVKKQHEYISLQGKLGILYFQRKAIIFSVWNKLYSYWKVKWVVTFCLYTFFSKLMDYSTVNAIYNLNFFYTVPLVFPQTGPTYFDDSVGPIRTLFLVVSVAPAPVAFVLPPPFPVFFFPLLLADEPQLLLSYQQGQVTQCLSDNLHILLNWSSTSMFDSQPQMWIYWDTLHLQHYKPPDGPTQHYTRTYLIWCSFIFFTFFRTVLLKPIFDMSQLSVMSISRGENWRGRRGPACQV